MKEKPIFLPGRIYLVTGDSTYTRQRMHELIVDLALVQPVKLLVGGNRYDHYGINYAIAAVAPDYERILNEHITLSRAETCYQMVELLIETQADEKPTLVLDLLRTFYDEGVPEQEINHLLFEARRQMRRLNQSAALIVSARSKESRPHLLNVLMNLAHHTEYPPLLPRAPERQTSFIE
jgi:hypothetical protein